MIDIIIENTQSKAKADMRVYATFCGLPLFAHGDLVWYHSC